MKKFLILIFVFCAFFVAAQTPPEIEWENNLGGSSSENAYDFIYTSDGGCILVGWTNSSDHDVEEHLGLSDLWIVKLNNSGNISWNKIYGGSNGGDIGSSIDRTDDGGFIVAGFTYSNDGDVSQPIGNGDAWLLKLDAMGNLEWEKTYGTPELLEKLHEVIALPNGKYFVSGSVTINEGTMNEETHFWIALLNGNGAIEWQQNFPGKHIEDIRKTSTGGYIMTGSDPNNFESWAVLLDEMGNTVWEQNFPDINNATNFFHLHSICETNDGGFVATGWWVDLPTTEAIALKLDASGNLLWNVLLGGSGAENLYEIHQTPDSGYILAGYSTSSDGDVSENNGGVDIWVVKLGETGNILWETNFGGSQNDKGNSILQTGEGEFIVLGTTLSDDGDVSEFYGINTNDIWVVKLNSNLGIADFAQSSAIQIYPNPVKTTFNIKTPGMKNPAFIFRDIRGRQIHIPSIGTNQNLYNATALQSGIYFVKISTSQASSVRKIIKK